MSFWDALFAGSVASFLIGCKEESNNSKNWNRLFDKLLELQDDFGDFLKNNGVGDSLCILDTDVIKDGEMGLHREQQRLTTLKMKIREFISLGGNPKNITNYEKTDLFLTQIKKLKKLDLLDQQDDFLGMYIKDFEFSIMIPYLYNQAPNINRGNEDVLKYLLEQKEFINSQLAASNGNDYDEWQITKEHLMRIQKAMDDALNRKNK